MKITFVRPNLTKRRSSDAIEPLEFAALHAVTPDEVEAELYDERIEEVPPNLSTDLVAITAQTYTARRAYELADAYLAQGIPVVLGGYHPTLVPEEAIQHASAVVVGEADKLWPTVVADARRGKLERFYRQESPLPLNGFRYQRSLFKGKKYSFIRPVEFTRGCKFSCDFCSVSVFNRRTQRSRPIDEVVEEIGQLGSKYILFIDDNMLTTDAHNLEFFNALAPLKIKWGTQMSLQVTRNEKLLRAMEKSGCGVVLLGIESLEPDNLKQMSKKTNQLGKNYAEGFQRLREHGIMIYGSFVFGYDHDTLDTFDRTVEFAIDHKFALANFNTLGPLPGTQLHRRLQAEKRLLREDWWLDEGFQYGEVAFIPRQMSAEELKKGCIRARVEFSSVRQILHRAFDFKTNCRSLPHLLVFLVSNWVARKEMREKMKSIQGI